MTDNPTHRHKATGDIVFWGEHLDPKHYEPLPDDHWEKTSAEAKRLGEEKTKREAKFVGWTIQEVAIYFEEKLTALATVKSKK